MEIKHKNQSDNKFEDVMDLFEIDCVFENKPIKRTFDEPNLENVGCEMCHSVAGGSQFRAIMKSSKGDYYKIEFLIKFEVNHVFQCQFWRTVI